MIISIKAMPIPFSGEVNTLKNLKRKEKKQLKKDISELLASTVVQTNNLDFVSVQSNNDKFTVVGCGCSSAVFRSKRFPQAVVKVYSPSHRKEVFQETLAYKKVKGLDCFPGLFFYGRNFLAIEFISGKSLYDCLIEGIDIADEVIEQVDQAIFLARQRGLAPSDVHFKNIILDNDRVRLIDLSDYLVAQHVSRWDRLKFFYKTVYKPLLKGSKVPKLAVDFFRKFYKLTEKLLKNIFK